MQEKDSNVAEKEVKKETKTMNFDDLARNLNLSKEDAYILQLEGIIPFSDWDKYNLKECKEACIKHWQGLINKVQTNNHQEIKLENIDQDLRLIKLQYANALLQHKIDIGEFKPRSTKQIVNDLFIHISKAWKEEQGEIL